MDTSRSEGSRTLKDTETQLAIAAIPDVHGHAKGEHRAFSEERPLPYSARMLFLWFYHACRRGSPRFLMVSDHVNFLTFEDPGAINTVRRALKLALAGDVYGAAETAVVDVAHATIVSDALRRGMRFSIGAEVDNDPRSRPDVANIIDAMRPDGIIRSIHFVPIEHPEKGADWLWAFDNPEFAHLLDSVGAERLWELYTHRLFEDISTLPTHIVGHFYVAATFGAWPDLAKLESYEDRLLEICKERGIAVEINLRFFYREGVSPEQRDLMLAAYTRLMRKASAAGVAIAIGSDAHSPKDQGNGFERIIEILRELEINEVVFPIGGRLAKVALRASREHIERAKRVDVPQPGTSIAGFSRAELGLPEIDEEEERRLAELRARSVRDVGSKRRAGSPERATKSPSAGSPETARGARSSPKRTAPTKPAKESPKEKASASTPPEPKAPVAKPAPAKKATAAPKTAVKSSAKPAAKAPAKPAAKTPAKPAAKAPAKPAAKTPAKPAAKPAAKPTVKKTVKPTAKTATKPTVKKTVKPTAKPAVKPIAKKAAKPAAKAAAKKVPPAKNVAPKRAAPVKAIAKKRAPVKPAAKKIAARPAAKASAKKTAGKKTASAKKSKRR
uniref:Histidinol-phosphatase n=1 Tax=mine drainage metagenome TaxID=410659 RepID=E6Q4X7_9ZZZZ